MQRRRLPENNRSSGARMQRRRWLPAVKLMETMALAAAKMFHRLSYADVGPQPNAAIWSIAGLRLVSQSR
jgi:hypothetical protein